MKHSWGLKIVSWALMLGGLGWVIYLLSQYLKDPHLLIPASWGWLGLATLLVGLSIMLNGIVFYLFLHPDGKKAYPLSRVLKLHYSAQLLRYLPGRIWGIVYQISAARDTMPARQIARANLDWMLFSLLASSLVALLLIASAHGWPWWVMFALLSAGIFLLALLFLGGVNWLLRRTSGALPRKLKHLLTALEGAQVTPKQLIHVVAVFTLSWMIYLAGWALLSKVFPVYAHVDFIVLCAYYTLASVLGIISAITPAGLGIREAAFLMMAAGSQGTEAVAFFALFGRVWLIVLEIALLMVPLALHINQRRNLQCH